MNIKLEKLNSFLNCVNRSVHCFARRRDYLPQQVGKSLVSLLLKTAVSTLIVLGLDPIAYAQQNELKVSFDSNLLMKTQPLEEVFNNSPLIAQQSSQTQLYSSITVDEMEALLNEMNLIFQRQTDSRGEPIFRIAINGYKVVMFFFNCSEKNCEDIQLSAGFRLNNRPNLEQMNDWTKQHRFIRVYLDKEGDPIIESDLFLDGGVSREHIKKFIVYFGQFVEKFQEFLVN